MQISIKKHFWDKVSGDHASHSTTIETMQNEKAISGQIIFLPSPSLHDLCQTWKKEGSVFDMLADTLVGMLTYPLPNVFHGWF